MSIKQLDFVFPILVQSLHPISQNIPSFHTLNAVQ